MHIKSFQTKKVSNSERCILYEYDYPSNASSIARAHMHGRYPEAGKVRNTVCEEGY